MRRRLLPALLLLFGSGPVRADARIGLIVPLGTAGSVTPFRDAATTALEARGDRVVASAEAEAESLRSPTVDAADLEAFGTVESLLVAARGASAELDEAAALRFLSTAAREARALLHVEGSAAWLAEVEIRTGAVAAQVGMTALAEDAFRRAYRLDPSRQLRSGEAAPEVVALAETVARRVDAGPRATLMVRCADAGAELAIDDRPQVACPARLDLPVGSHAIRVTAPGRRPYGALVDLAPGDRAPIEIALAPDAAVLAARAFDSESRDRPVERWPEALEALAEAGVPAEVLLFEVGQGPSPRALAIRCDAHGCTAPLPLEAGESLPATAPTTLSGPRAAAALRASAAFLRPGETASDADTDPRRRRRIALITTAVVVAAGIATGMGIALAPEPEQRLEVVVRPPSP